MNLSKINIHVFSSHKLPYTIEYVGKIPVTNSDDSVPIGLYDMQDDESLQYVIDHLERMLTKMPIVVVTSSKEVVNVPNHLILVSKSSKEIEEALFSCYMINVRAYYYVKVKHQLLVHAAPFKEDLSKKWRTTKAAQLASTYEKQLFTQQLPSILYEVANELFLPLHKKIAFYELEPRNVTSDPKQQKKKQATNKLQKTLHKKAILIGDQFEERLRQQLHQQFSSLAHPYLSVVEEALTPPSTLKTLNVAIIGQTGVGKSSLINYLFDSPKRLTGAGKPVTEQGFFEEKLLLNNVPVSLIDSWGIEQGKAELWQRQFEQFLKEHSYETSIANWVHVAIYCISAASSRVQDFDLSIIRMLQRQNINVIVALTKTSLVSKEATAQLTDALHLSLGDQMTIIPINSVHQSLLSGETIVPFGKEALIKSMQYNYITMLEQRMPDRIYYLIEQQIRHEDHRSIREAATTNDALTKSKELSKTLFATRIPAIIEHELYIAINGYDKALQLAKSRSTARRTRLTTPTFTVHQLKDVLEQFFKTTLFKLSPKEVAQQYEKKMLHELKQSKQLITDQTMHMIQSLKEEL